MSSSSSELAVRQQKRSFIYKQIRKTPASARERRKHFVPSIALLLLGKTVVVETALLLISTAIAYGGAAGNIISIVIDSLVALIAFANVVRLAYLLFGTRGEGHYYLTFWKIIDTLFGNMLGNVAVTLAMWKIARISQSDVFTITTFDKSPLTALGELASYSLLMLNGGGAVRQFPDVFVVEFVTSLQISWNLMVVIIIFSAADATLTVHTDEDPREFDSQK